MKKVLTVSNLSKRFDDFVAVDDISFHLNEGEILGFLGPNGAGKTTTLQMLLGVLLADKGKITYFGKNFVSHREEILEQVNFSSTYTNLPWNMSVKENLTFISYLYDIQDRKSRLSKIVDIFHLKELFHQPISELSAGQITRVNLAKAFINFPKVLLLDEPTASLDPDVASYIREFLLEERKKFQVSIIITSHNMAEVEQVCDRVIFINHGKVISDDTPENLARTLDISHLELLVTQGVDKLTALCKQEGLPFKFQHRTILIDIKDQNIPYFLKEIMDQGVAYDEISIEKPSLEDYFMQVAMKKKLD